MNFFLVVLWTLIGVMWAYLLYRTFSPTYKGKIALRTIEEFMEELGYEANQYNYIDKTSIREINWGDGLVRRVARYKDESDRKIAELTQRVYEIEKYVEHRKEQDKKVVSSFDKIKKLRVRNG